MFQQQDETIQPQQETTQPSQVPSTNHEEEQEEPWSSITEAVTQANTLLSTGTFSVYHQEIFLNYIEDKFDSLIGLTPQEWEDLFLVFRGIFARFVRYRSNIPEDIQRLKLRCLEIIYNSVADDLTRLGYLKVDKELLSSLDIPTMLSIQDVDDRNLVVNFCCLLHLHHIDSPAATELPQTIPAPRSIKRSTTLKLKNSPILKAQASFNDVLKQPLSPKISPKLLDQQNNFKETLKNELAPRDFS